MQVMKMTQPAIWSAYLISHARGTQTTQRSLRQMAMRDRMTGDSWRDFRSRGRNFLGRVSAAILRYVPLGYEDQNGFRFGEVRISQDPFARGRNAIRRRKKRAGSALRTAAT